jgi:hypothetical protein
VQTKIMQHTSQYPDLQAKYLMMLFHKFHTERKWMPIL